MVNLIVEYQGMGRQTKHPLDSGGDPFDRINSPQLEELHKNLINPTVDENTFKVRSQSGNG